MINQSTITTAICDQCGTSIQLQPQTDGAILLAASKWINVARGAADNSDKLSSGPHIFCGEVCLSAKLAS